MYYCIDLYQNNFKNITENHFLYHIGSAKHRKSLELSPIYLIYKTGKITLVFIVCLNLAALPQWELNIAFLFLLSSMTNPGWSVKGIQFVLNANFLVKYHVP